jgi:hypothetical protein
MRQMKKKGTRKIRKNRQTKRRNNRSYKRMRGGMYPYTTSTSNWGFGTKQHKIPDDVRSSISRYYQMGRLTLVGINTLQKTYTKIMPPITDEQKQFYDNYDKLIMEEIKKFTQKTGEPNLIALPLTTAKSLQIIERLVKNEFLPEVKEFGELLSLFNHETPDTTHKKPFKFNGLALALSIMNIYYKHALKKTTTAATKAGSGGHAATAPDLTGVPQIYFIWLAPHPQSTTRMGWTQKPLDLVLQSNPYCPSNKRTQIRTVDGVVLNDENKAKLTYTTAEFKDIPNFETRIERMNGYIRFLRMQTTQPGTYIVIVDQPGIYIYYELQKIILEEEVSHNPARSSCKVEVTVYVIKQYAEDGIADRVYVEYSYRPLLGQQSPTTCQDNVIIPVLLKEKYVDSVKKELSTAFTGYENAIEIQIGTERGVSPQTTPMITTPQIIMPDDTYYGISTLMISFPPSFSHPIWNVAKATTIQSDAFTSVQKYIRDNRSAIDTIKVFSIKNTNAQNPIHVHIIVKETSDHGGSIIMTKAEYVHSSGETYYLFPTRALAESEARNKTIKYDQVVSSGPSTHHYFFTPPPPPSYGAPPPPPSYGAHPPGYGAHPPGYGAHPPGYGAHPPSYGAPPPGYGAPPPGYGAPPPGYGGRPSSHKKRYKK